MCRAYSLELTGRVVEGRLEVGPCDVSAGRVASPGAGLQPPVSATSAEVVGHGQAASTPSMVAKVVESRCSVAVDRENFLKEPGFEQSSSRWVLVNRKSSFRRIDATEPRGWANSPALESKVMMLKPASHDDNRNDGPPYITQEILLPSGTKRIRVCCDLAYAGAITREAGMRVSITNPNVYYTEGGKTFPFTRVGPLTSKQWRHVEWEVDVSAMGARRLVLGYMFPFSNEPWYIDNTKVTSIVP